MSLFHDEEDGPSEPVHGLPERLPEGEKVLWQGRPSMMGLVFGAFRLRWVLFYFAAMTVFRLANLSANEAASEQLAGVLTSSMLFCAIALILIFGLSYAMSRAAVFTITSERVVMRYGAAIRKYVNVPFSKMAGAQLKRRSARVGDISMKIEGGGQPGYLHLWPFVRPFKYTRPEPMMRSIKDPDTVANLLARAVFEHAPENVRMELETREPKPEVSAPPSASIPAT